VLWFLALRDGAGVAESREQRALAGRRGAGRPELDLLGYAPRSQRWTAPLEAYGFAPAAADGAS